MQGCEPSRSPSAWGPSPGLPRCSETRRTRRSPGKSESGTRVDAFNPAAGAREGGAVVCPLYRR